MKRIGKAAQVGTRQAWLWRNRDAFGDSVSKSLPRLLVDVSAIIRHDAQTGIQRVVRAVWSELRRRSGITFEALPVYATASHGYCYAPPDFLETQLGAQPRKAVGMRSADKFLGLDLSAHLLPKYRRQLRAWRAHGATVHLVVYDLLPLQRPGWFTTNAVNHFQRWFDVLAEEADQAICISDHVARSVTEQLERVGNARRPLIARLRMGADIAATMPSSGLCSNVTPMLERMRFRPAILMVGTVEPRKGYEAALNAFSHLWARRPDSPELVLVGKPGWKTEGLQKRIKEHPEFGRHLHWFDQMSDEGLCLLYDACRGVLMASRGEGWGLPLVEAAMHRRFVLARDLPVFREHNLPNVVYFEDDSTESLGERLLELSVLGQNSAPAAELPTWSEAVDGLLSAMGFADAQAPLAETLLRKAS